MGAHLGRIVRVRSLALQVFVINLAHRTDRMLVMRQQLSAQAIAFTRIEAVNGLGDADIGYPKSHPNLSKAEFACYLSHVKCWETFVESGEAYALILEDDVAIGPSLSDVLRNPEFFNHGHAITRLEVRNSRVTLARKPLKTIGKFTLYAKMAYNGGTGAYVLTRDYAKYLLAQHAAPHLPVDDLVLDPSNTQYDTNYPVQVTPALCMQFLYLDTSESNLDLGSDLLSRRGAFVQKNVMYPPLGKKLVQELTFVFRNNQRFGKRARRRVRVAFEGDMRPDLSPTEKP